MNVLQSQRGFIFENEFHRLVLSKIRQEEQGNLFGLWTNAGEPVIYIISGLDCRPQSNRTGSAFTDIPNSRFPLVHIGNWRRCDSSARFQRQSPIIESLRCPHETESNFLYMIIKDSKMTVSYINSKKKIENIVWLPHESPFRNMEGFKEIAIKGQDENCNTELSEMQRLSVTTSFPTSRRHAQDESSHTDDSQNMKQTSFTNVVQKLYVFEKDFDIVISKVTQERRGNLFGLWTTSGEPVIHIMSGPNCCPQSDQHSSRPEADILTKDSPLTHIGNWRYDDVSSSSSQTISRQLDDFWCPHKTQTKFVDAIVTQSTLQWFMDGKERKMEVLSGKSPFRGMEGIKRIAIKGQHEDFNTELKDMKQISVTKGFRRSSKRITKESSNSSDSENADSNSHNIARTSRLQEGPLYQEIRGFQGEFAVNRHNFKVFMFEEDRELMTNFVLKYPHLETGGDLFGLWTTEGNAVLHIVLGPGQNCKRTGASFYQDIPYLKQNGELITEDYMLCHIGEWHSHHQLHLFQPSGGDSSTVIRNYPTEVCGFLLIIANIVSPRQVEFSPYLYTKTSSHRFDQKGKIELLRAQNAFKQISRIKQSIDRGKETESYSQGALYRYSEYSHKSHDSRGYPFQTSKAIECLPQAREPIKHTLQHRYPKQCLPNQVTS